MTRLLAALSLALLAACSAIDPYNMIGRQFGEASGLPTNPVPDGTATVLDVAAREIAPHLPIAHAIHENLVLDGLALIARSS